MVVPKVHMATVNSFYFILFFKENISPIITCTAWTVFLLMAVKDFLRPLMTMASVPTMLVGTTSVSVPSAIFSSTGTASNTNHTYFAKIPRLLRDPRLFYAKSMRDSSWSAVKIWQLWAATQRINYTYISIENRYMYHMYKI